MGILTGPTQEAHHKAPERGKHIHKNNEKHRDTKKTLIKKIHLGIISDMRITSRDALFLCLGVLFAFILIPSEKGNQIPTKNHSALQETNTATSIKNLIKPATLTERKLQNTSPKENSRYEKLGHKKLKIHSIQAKTAPHNTNKERAPQSIDLILKENDILTLENTLHSLRDQIWTRLSKSGWRLYGPINTTPLAHAGFQAGDVVTFESINNLKNSTEHSL